MSGKGKRRPSFDEPGYAEGAGTNKRTGRSPQETITSEERMAAAAPQGRPDETSAAKVNDTAGLGEVIASSTTEEHKARSKQVRRMTKLKRRQGEVLSVNEMRSLLRQYYTMTLVDGMTHREAVNRIHHLDGISTTILEEAVKEWDMNARVRVRDGSSRGAGNKKKASSPDTAFPTKFPSQREMGGMPP